MSDYHESDCDCHICMPLEQDACPKCGRRLTSEERKGSELFKVLCEDCIAGGREDL